MVYKNCGLLNVKYKDKILIKRGGSPFSGKCRCKINKIVPIKEILFVFFSIYILFFIYQTLFVLHL